MTDNPLLTVVVIAAVAGAGWVGWELASPDPFVPAPVSAAAPDLFECRSPTHHDGDAIRCDGQGRSMRLTSIDAPEMPGSCRPGRQCTPGDPYASRDHLASLTRGRNTRCRIVDANEKKPGFQERDAWGRQIVQCFAGDVDLSCKMVADGFAVERYGKLDC